MGEGNDIKQVRRSRTDEMYGISRGVVSRKKINAQPLEPSDLLCWKVRVLKIGVQKGVVQAFPLKRFVDQDFPGDKAEQEQAALSAAKQYRDEELAKLGIKTERREIKVRQRVAEVKFKRVLTRLDDTMRGITRDERAGNKQDGTKAGSSGWRVRIGAFQGFFGDRLHGGKDQALAAAKVARDSVSAPKKTDLNPLSYAIKEARVHAGISQDIAAKWMGVGHVVFSKMERGKIIPKEKFVELFTLFAKSQLNPFEELPKPDLKQIRVTLHLTQSQMSAYITGNASQAPWAGWESGRNAIPSWAHKYLVQVLMPKIAAKVPI